MYTRIHLFTSSWSNVLLLSLWTLQVLLILAQNEDLSEGQFEAQFNFDDPSFRAQAERNRLSLSTVSSSTSSTTENVFDPLTATAAADSTAETFQTRQANNNNKVEMNLLVVLLKFENHKTRTLPSANIVESWFTGTGVSDEIPAGSIGNWTASNSYGGISLNAGIQNWHTSAYTESYIAANNRGVDDGNGVDGVSIMTAVVEAMEALDRRNVVFSAFDSDSDFRIDSLLILHSGYAAEVEGDDCETNAGSMDRIRTLAYGTSNLPWKSSSGYVVGNVAVASALRGTCGMENARIGVMLHEVMHTVGLPDLYDLGGFLNEDMGSVGGLGGYDTMASTSGQNQRQATPGFLSPWSKYKMGWVEPIEITEDGVYTARASELHPDIFMISSPYPTGEYLMIENRQPLSFDSGIWGAGGILIYQVDDTTDRFGNYERGWPGQSGWPGNGNHYQVSVLQADGLYELEQSLNNGGIEDFWKSGDILGPGNGEQVASAAGTYPNTDAYQNGDVKVTGVTIDEFTETAPGVWSFRVSGIRQVAEPSPTNAPVEAPTNAPVAAPTNAPVAAPTKAPVEAPTNAPVDAPTNAPVDAPTSAPVDAPTNAPVDAPTDAPVDAPTDAPVDAPTDVPDPVAATDAPILAPSEDPTAFPSLLPSLEPSSTPSISNAPTVSAPPSQTPSVSLAPTVSISPSSTPSVAPSAAPSASPSMSPSVSMRPSSNPSMSSSPSVATESPTIAPTNIASASPSRSSSSSGGQQPGTELASNGYQPSALLPLMVFVAVAPVIWSLFLI